MKVEPVRGPKFAGIVRKHGGAAVPPTPVLVRHEPNDPLAILLTNYLLWESTPPAAEAALAQLSLVLVDGNELRVMLEPEVAEAIGSTRESLRVDVCSNCHPFFTGKQMIMDTAGQVERFQRRLDRAQSGR